MSDTRRSFLARLVAWVAALFASPPVAPCLLDDMEPALPDSHAEDLAAFDRDLGYGECEGGCGALVPVTPITEWTAGLAAAYMVDGGHEAVPGAPTMRLAAMCRPCADRQSCELVLEAEISRRAELRYENMPLGLIDVIQSKRDYGTSR